MLHFHILNVQNRKTEMIRQTTFNSYSVLTYCKLKTKEQASVKFHMKFIAKIAFGNVIYKIVPILLKSSCVNTLGPRQNGRRFDDDTFKRIFLNENVRISIKISLKFVPKGPINNNPVLVQIMAWRRSGDEPLSEPMMVRILAHICVTRPQWVNRPGPFHIYIFYKTRYGWYRKWIQKFTSQAIIELHDRFWYLCYQFVINTRGHIQIGLEKHLCNLKGNYLKSH